MAAVTAISAGGSAAPAHASVTAYYLDRDVAAYVRAFTGDPYLYGGTSPAGFDCSGLTQYAYGHFGYRIPRTAEEQYRYFRQIPGADARPGDLVFFHDSSGYAYHAGIYEGGGTMISALNYSYGVKQTPVSWGGTYVTYGSITH